jgi:hypothetical protein
MNNKGMPNYDAELRTKLAKTTRRPSKRLLDGTETGLLRPNSRKIMMLIFLIFSDIFTDRRVIVLNIFFIILLANCGYPVLNFDFLGLSRAIVWLVILKLLMYEISLMFFIITYTLDIFAIYYTYSAVYYQYRHDEIQMDVSQQHVYSAIALNELVSIWSHQIYGGMELRDPFMMCLTKGLDVYRNRCRRRCCCVFSCLVMLCG